MKINKSIQLKAAFLLTVFALNTVVAFACSLGVDMGFNKYHHDENKEQVVAKHSHHHSTPHHHEHTTVVTGHNHEHSTGVTVHHHEKSEPGNDGCCNDKAIQFQQVDKSLRNTTNLLIKAPVFVAFMSAFYGVEMKNPQLALAHTVIIPQYYPPPDIRITIQSFQI